MVNKSLLNERFIDFGCRIGRNWDFNNKRLILTLVEYIHHNDREHFYNFLSSKAYDINVNIPRDITNLIWNASNKDFIIVASLIVSGIHSAVLERKGRRDFYDYM